MLRIGRKPFHLQPAQGPAPVSLPGGVPELLKAGAAGALIKACGQHCGSPRAAEALLLAIVALAAEPAGRGGLVDAGALSVLQPLMGHKAVVVSRLAAAASQQLFVK